MEKAVESYKFIKAQTNAIETSKFIESQKEHRDLYYDEQGKPSQKFYEWWIEKHAKEFRAAWATSLCKNCSRVVHCKNCLKNECDNFDKNAER